LKSSALVAEGGKPRLAFASCDGNAMPVKPQKREAKRAPRKTESKRLRRFFQQGFEEEKNSVGD
jgi:hypothetical protein